MSSTKKSINNNIIILPEPSTIVNPIKYLQTIFTQSHNSKKLSQYLDELNEDIPNFASAVCLLTQAIISGKKIGIIGDYDVDGTVGTSIITLFFNWLNATGIFKFAHIYHIPNRFKEGYGPSVIAIERFINEKVNLIITVDSGTTANKEIQLAKDGGMDTIILDHHLIQNETPEATCFVNCQNSNNFKNLSGGGLAFLFLICLQKNLKSLYKDMPNFDFTDFVDLAALSTVCDFVSFDGINKLLVEFGLKKFNWQYNSNISSNKLNKAIHIILQYSMYHYNSSTHIRAADLGFAIGPYLNAAGRMLDGNLVVQFLTTVDTSSLEDIFFQLQSLWQERRKLQDEIIFNLEKNYVNNKSFVLLYGEDIHEGIMGIIAAQFKEKYNKPAIVIAFNRMDDNHNGQCIGKASIRSVGSFNAGEFIELALKRDILIKGGGHHMAGGFVIKKENIPKLEEFLSTYMTHQVNEEKKINVHLILPINNLDKEFYDLLHTLGPFGIDHEEPVLLFPNLVIKSIYLIGGKHLSFRLSDITERYYLKAIWFSLKKELIEKLIVGLVFTVIGNIKMVNGKIEIYIIDAIIES